MTEQHRVSRPWRQWGNVLIAVAIVIAAIAVAITATSFVASALVDLLLGSWAKGS